MISATGPAKQRRHRSRNQDALERGRPHGADITQGPVSPHERRGCEHSSRCAQAGATTEQGDVPTHMYLRAPVRAPERAGPGLHA